MEVWLPRVGRLTYGETPVGVPQAAPTRLLYEVKFWIDTELASGFEPHQELVYRNGGREIRYDPSA